MADLSIDLRRRVVEAYLAGRTATYAETATVFAIGYATVNRLLRRKRETGDVLSKPKGGNNPRRVDLNWLEENARSHPDARLIDRAAAWKEHSGRAVSISAISRGLHAIGWTHKKRRPLRASATALMSKRSGKTSSPSR